MGDADGGNESGHSKLHQQGNISMCQSPRRDKYRGSALKFEALVNEEWQDARPPSE